MRTLFGRSGISGIVLAFAFATTSAPGQQGVHATVVPQASRQAAPAFQLTDSSGTNKQVTDYRGKLCCSTSGRPIAVDANWKFLG